MSHWNCICFVVVLLLTGYGYGDDVRENGKNVSTTKPPNRVSQWPSLVNLWNSFGPQVKYMNSASSPAAGLLDFFIRLRMAFEPQLRKDLFARNGDICVVFVGDSLIENWSSVGGAVWDKYYEPLKSINLGIGRLTTDQLNDGLRGGMLDLLRPKVVVLLIGINDLILVKDAEGRKVAENIGISLDLINDKVPGAKILLLGLLPEEWSEDTVGQRKIVNELIKKYDNGNRTRYLELGKLFGTEEGVVYPDLFLPDSLHLASKGYEVMAMAMDPLLKEMLEG